MMLHTLLDIKLLGIDMIQTSDFLELLLRFTLNMVAIVIIIRYLYYTSTRRKDYLFTYILISITVFLLCFLLENVKLQLGFALGLFAIFGIIRYRTTTIPIREMTYLFVVIALSVINALANKQISYAELLFSNFIIVFACYGFEKLWLLKHRSRKTIVYEKIENVHPAHYDALKQDLEERTGLSIEKIEVGNIDFLRDTARIRIYYYEPDNEINEANDENEVNRVNSNNDNNI
ncbi:MAG TPA: DUF4956 domain-containing protein [Bacteroidales bacterium]|nr:DUF4956 domain-containing protein [Bacteroidales bacterium]